MGIHGVGAAALFLGQQCGQPHLLKEVEAVVAGRTVGTQTDVDAFRHQFADRSNAAGKLEVGAGAVCDEHPCWASSSISCASRCTPCTAISAGLSRSQATDALDRAHPEALHAFVDFLDSFMQMEMYRQFDLLGKRQHLGKAGVADGVGRMRRQAERQQRLIQQLVADRQPLGQIVVRIGCIVARKVDRDQADCGAHSRSQRGVGRSAGERNTCR
jgi:hypothetical protein